jgi:HEAT repeat protein
MQGLLVVAAVLGMQQPVMIPPIAPIVPIVARAHAALATLDRLDPLDALDAGAPGNEVLLPDEQDPTDSLWRAARRALNRADYQQAADLYGDLARRYPNTTRAGDALYWAAFALYKNDNLDEARSLLVRQQQRYSKAATLRDGDALLARIQTALAKQGDEDAHRWIIAHAQQSAGADTARVKPCPGQDDENDEDDVRVAALNGLLQMDEGNAVPILKKVLARRDACSAALRRKAVFILSQKHTAETEDVLLGVARNDPDPEVRQQAVFWLSQVGSDRAVSALDSILRSSTDVDLQDKAIFALSQIHKARAAQILRDYAGNERASGETREKAIFWLGQQQSPENGAFLRGLYAKLTDEDLKEKVIFSLSQMGGADNARWLMDVALNEREPIEMRKKSLFWAGQTGGNLDELVGLYDRMQNDEMNDQLIFVYSQRHEPAALDKLIQIAKTERDKELRKKALFWLGQSHDPRAAQVLLEIINQ